LLYFAVAAARFPHDVPTYTTGMLAFGVILIGLVPAVLGLTFYMFDFPAWKKLALTLLRVRNSPVPAPEAMPRHA